MKIPSALTVNLVNDWTKHFDIEEYPKTGVKYKYSVTNYLLTLSNTKTKSIEIYPMANILSIHISYKDVK